jgi:hypothetical protein
MVFSRDKVDRLTYVVSHHNGNDGRALIEWMDAVYVGEDASERLWLGAHQILSVAESETLKDRRSSTMGRDWFV